MKLTNRKQNHREKKDRELFEGQTQKERERVRQREREREREREGW